MKAITTLLLALGALLPPAMGQQVKKELIPVPSVPCHKITSNDNRLIARAYWWYVNGGFVQNDSTVLAYSGDNGWDYALGDWKCDSSFTLQYDALNMQWDETEREYKQVVSGRVMSKLMQQLSGTTWEDQQKTTYTYTNGMLESELFENNTGSGLDTVYKYTRAYNSNKVLTEIMTYRWNVVTSQLEVATRDLYHYDTQGREDTITTQRWNSIASQWEDSSRTINNFAAAPQVALQQYYIGSIWQDSLRSLGTMDSDGYPLVWEHEVWDAATTTWLKDTRYEMQYNTDKDVTEVKMSIAIGTMYEYAQRQQYTFESVNRVKTMETQTYNSSTSQWVYSDGADIRLHNYYEPYTNGVSDAVSQPLPLQVFPIPAANIITVSATFTQPQQLSVTLTDATGRLVKHWTEPSGRNYHRTIDIANLPAGNYILNIEGAHQHARQQIVIVR